MLSYLYKRKKTTPGAGEDGPQPDARIPNLPDKLSKLCGNLDVCCRSKEPAFIKLGEKLQEIYAQAVGLSKNVLETAQQIEHFSGQDFFKHIDKHLVESIDKFSIFSKDVHADLDSIHAITDSLGRLFLLREQIKGIARHLYPIALNMIIENMRSSKANAGFDGIGNEIKSLSNDVNRFALEIQKTTDKTRIKITSTCEQTENDLSRLAGLVNESKKKVMDSTNKTNQLISFSHAILEQADHRSEAVTEQIGEVVMGIQLHDSIRQRIEHIEKSLHDAKSLYAESEAFPVSDKRVNEKMGRICLIVKLQTAQIKQIKSDIEDVYNVTVDAFEKVSGEVTELASGLVMIDEMTKKKTDNPLTSLNEILSHLQQLFNNGHELTRQLIKIPELIFITTNELSTLISRIQTLSHDAQNKALNAMISTTRLGKEGKTLNVLAQEMKELSIELKTIVSDVLDFIASISGKAQYMENKYEKYRNRTDRDTTTYDAITTVIREISQINKQFNQNAVEISANTDDLKEKINLTREDLSFFRIFSRELDQNLNEIQEIYNLVIPWETDSRDINASLIYQDLEKRYTMQKERTVSKEVTQIAGDKDKGLSNDPDSGIDHDKELGGNVELF